MISKDKNIDKACVSAGFVYLFLVSFLGVLLRSNVFMALPLPYNNILHAHSHTALLGWAFVMSSTQLLFFLKLNYSKFKFEWLGISIAIIGMLISFLYQAYGTISITFSTLFIFASYLFLYKIYEALKKFSIQNKFFQWSIIWFFISTLGIWCIGPCIALLGKENDLYNLSIQFFLHFQINGWLIYVVLGFLMKNVKKDLSKKLILGLNTALILTFCLNVYWVNENSIFYLLNGLGVILQAIVLFKILQQIISHKQMIKQGNKIQWFYGSILISLGLKAIIPMISLIPHYALSLEYNRFLIIAFLHLILIGVVSFSHILYSIQFKFLPFNKVTQTGLILWVLGFVITELLMALQGFGIYHYMFFYLLFLFSLFMFLGITLLLYQQIKRKDIIHSI